MIYFSFFLFACTAALLYYIHKLHVDILLALSYLQAVDEAFDDLHRDVAHIKDSMKSSEFEREYKVDLLVKKVEDILDHQADFTARLDAVNDHVKKLSRKTKKGAEIGCE